MKHLQLFVEVIEPEGYLDQILQLFHGRCITTRLDEKKTMAAPLAQRLTPKKRALFLASLAQLGNVTEAARVVGCSRDAVYHWRHRDMEFATAWDDALEQAADVLELEAWRRAHDGVTEPLTSARGLIYDKAGEVVTIQKYSDTLLIFLLKGARPQKYRENLKITGSIEHSLVPRGAAAALVMELMTAVQDMPEARAALAQRLLTDGTSGTGSDEEVGA